MQSRAVLVKSFSYIFLSVSSFIMIYPVLFMALGSFTTNDRFLDATILPIPNTLNIQLFQRALGAGVWDAYVFTLKRCAFFIGITLLVGLIGGYNGFYAHPTVYVENNAIKDFTVMKTNNAVTTGIPTNPFTGGNSNLRYLTSGTNIMRNRDILGPTGLPLYLVPGTADKSIYDWSSVNIVAPNHGYDKANTVSGELEQIVLSTPNHLIAARIGAFQQKFESDVDGAIDNLETVIYVDVNEKRLDGTANPNFKRPFLQATSPSRTGWSLRVATMRSRKPAASASHSA